jgi:hypothetical protein
VWRRITLFAFAAFVLCSASGCYEKAVHGDQSVYSFATWLRILAIVGGIVMIPAGWFLRRASEKYGYTVVALGPLFLLVVAPAMFNDRVVVDAEHFEARYGIWISPYTHNVRFDDLREIHHVGVPGRRNRTTYQLHCFRKDGGEPEVVPIGDLVVNAVPEILDRAAAKKVHVVRPAE